MLSDSAAYAIATTWLAPLQGCVQLVIDHEHGPIRSIVESYTWVRITPPTRHYASLCDLQEEAIERAAIVRAAMTTWVWLSNCTGYSGRANPTFWKRVFSAFQETAFDQSSNSSRRPAPPVTDAITFFDQPNHEFPRFMVEVNDLYYNEPDHVDARRIFGLGTSISDSDLLTPLVAAAVTHICSQLAPFMDHQLISQRDIDVCITVETFLLSAVYGRSPYTVLTRFVQDVNARTPPHDPYQGPKLRIVQFLEDGVTTMGSTIHQEGFAQFVRAVPLRYSHFALHQPMRDLTIHGRAQWVSSFCRLDSAEVQAHVHSLSFLRHVIDDAMVAALFSALPFAQSVKSLTIDTVDISRGGADDRRGLAWLAYMIFHPRSKISSCRHIEWRYAALNDQIVDCLQAMTRGNNLLAVLHGTPPRSDAYYSGTLDAGTHIRLEPSSTSEVLYQVSNATTRVDVCDVSSLDPATWTEWVGVVVPGYGLGWVRSRQLHDIRADAPSVRSLTGLTLHSGRNYNLKAMVRVLAVLGVGLTYLDIGAYAEVDTATLNDIMEACPSLKVLKVCYGGNPWHQSVEIPVHCKLDELEMVVPDDVRAIHLSESATLTAPLQNLRALRISVNGNRVLAASGSVLKLLVATASSLRYLHWQNTSSSPTNSYRASQARTQALLQELQLSNEGCSTAQGTTTSLSAVAMLSVARTADHAAVSVLSRVVTNRDLLGTIFQFATRSMLSTICVEPDEMKVSVPVPVPVKEELTWCEWLKTSLQGIVQIP